MINAETFRKHMGLLAEHYQAKKIQPAILGIYKKHLDKNLTEPQFVESVEMAVIKYPVRHGLPSAQELVDLVRGTLELQAMEEWQIIIRACSTMNYEHITYISNRARVGLSAIGGMESLGNCTREELIWKQKDFLKVYCQCPNKDTQMLKAASLTKTAESVDVEYVTSEQWQQLRQQIESIAQRRSEKSRIRKTPAK